MNVNCLTPVMRVCEAFVIVVFMSSRCLLICIRSVSIRDRMNSLIPAVFSVD